MPDTDDEGFSILDENGRLFGLVNVVDLLVVLLILAVVVAGAALLLPGSASEQDTRYATIDLGSQPGFVAEQISAGDTFDPDRTSDALTVTDVYRFDRNDQIGVIVRAAINGTVREPEDPDDPPVFEFRGDPLRVGQGLPIQTPEYEVQGNITQVQRSGDRLPVEQSEFVLETTVSPQTAAQIDVGDEFRSSGTTVAEITALEAFPRGDEQYLLVGISAQTIEQGGSQRLGETRLSVGATVPFAGDGYEIAGSVIQRGTGEIQRTDTSVIGETTVSASTAASIAVGDTYRLDDETVGTIQSVSLFPGGEDDQRYALLEFDLKTSERDGTPRFAGQPLRLGSSFPFQTASYQLSVDVLERGAGELSTETRPFVIETTVPTTVATDIRVGDEFRLGGETIVRVESVTVYATDTADVRRVILGVSAVTREADGTVLFGDRQLRLGSQLPVETGEYDISGEIIRRGTLTEPGEPVTRTITLGVDNIRPERADTIEAGLTEDIRDRTIAEITSKSTEPAAVILESETGEIFLREHPRNLDVELAVELNVRQLENGSLRFRGEPLRIGETLTLDLGNLRITGAVRSIDT